MPMDSGDLLASENRAARQGAPNATRFYDAKRTIFVSRDEVDDDGKRAKRDDSVTSTAAATAALAAAQVMASALKILNDNVCSSDEEEASTQQDSDATCVCGGPLPRECCPCPEGWAAASEPADERPPAEKFGEEPDSTSAADDDDVDEIDSPVA